ncbi:hypothetical protein [Streptomyces sp. NPDC046805]|uniref:hypothetical protein n=1 Tax=Streptomyces sp. NPDC046805 TaxID=3155134 RepID=UPI0033EF0241
MTTWRMSLLVLRHRIRREGRSSYLLRISVLAVLNTLLLSGLFTTVSGHAFDFGLLSEQYGYFIPLTALSAAVGSWETELFSGLGERYLGHPSWVWRTRLLSVAVECAVPFLLFAVGLAATGADHLTDQLITLVAMGAVFALFGSALGFCIGFRHEKAVNNFINLIPWVLGFGPGPFFGKEAYGPAVLLPGGFSAEGRFGWEWVKLGVIALLAWGLLVAGSRARRHRFYP